MLDDKEESRSSNKKQVQKLPGLDTRPDVSSGRPWPRVRMLRLFSAARGGSYLFLGQRSACFPFLLGQLGLYSRTHEAWFRATVGQPGGTEAAPLHQIQGLSVPG